MKKTGRAVDISIIVPVGARHADIAGLYAEYKAGLQQLAMPCEFIFVLDGARPAASSALQQLLAQGEDITVISLTRKFGESTALMAGFEQASGRIIVTLPAYHQIRANEVGKLVGTLDKADLAIGYRWPRAGGGFEHMRREMFHWLLSAVTGQRYRDLGCSARAMHRRVLEEISLYGDQHRFLPVLAHRNGFRVVHVEMRQSPHDRFAGGYGPREYAHSLLDIFTVLFLVRFTHKPLRFFGMVGATTLGIGVLLTGWLVVDRLVFHHALADRPALLLSSLLVVLGMQVFALGLLGELIIFTPARHLKDYQIAEVVRRPALQKRSEPEQARSQAS
jgi:glycosyltransferase involved in cell wall biosynthesis